LCEGLRGFTAQHMPAEQLFANCKPSTVPSCAATSGRAEPAPKNAANVLTWQCTWRDSANDQLKIRKQNHPALCLLEKCRTKTHGCATPCGLLLALVSHVSSAKVSATTERPTGNHVIRHRLPISSLYVIYDHGNGATDMRLAATQESTGHTTLDDAMGMVESTEETGETHDPSCVHWHRHDGNVVLHEPWPSVGMANDTASVEDLIGHGDGERVLSWCDPMLSRLPSSSLPS